MTEETIIILPINQFIALICATAQAEGYIGNANHNATSISRKCRDSLEEALKAMKIEILKSKEALNGKS